MTLINDKLPKSFQSENILTLNKPKTYYDISLIT